MAGERDAVATAAGRTFDLQEGRVRVAVHELGAGPPLVFLHGPDGLRPGRFLDELACRYRVFAPLFPTPADGLGELHELWDVVLLFAELLDRLGLGETALVGHSVGGMYAAELGATYPARVSKLVLLDAAGVWLDDVPAPDMFGLPADEVARLLFADPEGELALDWVAQPEDLELALDRREQLAAATRFVWPLPDRGLRRRAHRIAAPTLVVWGRGDRLYPLEYAYELVRLIRGARLEIVEGAAHYPHLEQPETTARAVLGFLDR